MGSLHRGWSWEDKAEASLKVKKKVIEGSMKDSRGVSQEIFQDRERARINKKFIYLKIGAEWSHFLVFIIFILFFIPWIIGWRKAES